MSAISLNELAGKVPALMPVNRGSRPGKVREYVPDETETDETEDTERDEALLERVVKAAAACAGAEFDLRVVVGECCASDVDRDDVIEAIIDGGWSNSRARSLVSEVYCASGKRVKEKGQGRKASKEAVAIYKLCLEKFGAEDLAKHLLGASRYAAKMAKK